MISYHGRSKSEIIRNHKVCLEKMKVFALTAGITLAQNVEVTTTVAPSANEVRFFLNFLDSAWVWVILCDSQWWVTALSHFDTIKTSYFKSEGRNFVLKVSFYFWMTHLYDAFKWLIFLTHPYGSFLQLIWARCVYHIITMITLKSCYVMSLRKRNLKRNAFRSKSYDS